VPEQADARPALPLERMVEAVRLAVRATLEAL